MAGYKQRKYWWLVNEFSVTPSSYSSNENPSKAIPIFSFFSDFFETHCRPILVQRDKRNPVETLLFHEGMGCIPVDIRVIFLRGSFRVSHPKDPFFSDRFRCLFGDAPGIGFGTDKSQNEIVVAFGACVNSSREILRCYLEFPRCAQKQQGVLIFI